MAKREVYKVQNVDVTLEARNLLHKAVPVYKYGKKGERLPGDPGVLYHVNIQFASFEDLVNMAIDKVLHSVGHSIADGKIRTEAEAEEAGDYTTVLSSGKPPEATREKVLANAKTMVETAATEEAKTEMAAAIMEMMKAAGIDPKILAKLAK